MINFIKEKSKIMLEKMYKVAPIVLTIALAIVQTLILISINSHLEIYFSNIDVYIVVVPILFIVLISWTSNKNIFKIQRQGSEYQQKLICLKNSFIVTVFIYMIAILINFSISNRTNKIIVTIICFGAIYLSLVSLKDRLYLEIDNKLNIKNDKENKLFNTYYINISKVFEIAMLINNKVVISIENEKIIEENESINENLSTNINIDYLNSIKSGISFQDAYIKSNSAKNKVLENLEVKTTKSNLLDTIIKKSKEYKQGYDIKPGDLILFNDVEIKLRNEKETMETTRMLINGAFNGANISSTTNDMKMDLNMSSLINSMLKDCSYELECSVNGFKFCIKIPMSFDNDFESNYNIYDILIGKMSLIGIYRGKDKEKKYKNAFEFFNSKQNESSSAQNLGLKQSANYRDSSINDEIATDNTNNKRAEDDNTDYVDIIAIIKEINIDINKDNGEENE